ncbi:MAG: S8 family serine peptidase [Eggerthellaceae bacterium]|nr:S8 family serine peptidase [Eggerthellaceae bacterium]
MRLRASIDKVLAALVAAMCLVLGVVVLQSGSELTEEQGKPVQTIIETSEQVDGDQELPRSDDAVVTDVGEQVADSAENGADSERLEDEAMVLLADDCSVEELNESLAQLDFVATEGVSEQDVALGWVRLHLKPGCDLDWALDELDECDAIAETQPNYVYHLLGDEEANGSSVQALAATGQDSLIAGGADLLTQTAINDAVALAAYDNRWWLESVGAYEAWDKVETSGAVTVAVVDSGCATSHQELAQAVSPANCYNALTGTTGFSAVNDTDGHGTHVCGIIAATPNNGIGIAGISYGARLMPVKVVNASTTSTAYLVKAYQFIMKRRSAGVNVRIINVSMGGKRGYDPALMRAIDQAYSEYGILSVFAAGNEGSSAPYYCFPCDYSEVGLGVISVGQETANSLRGEQDYTSNYNKGSEKTKEISAPGIGIVSTYPVDRSSKSSYGKGYWSLSGTSMAASVVSGIAALVWTSNPSLSPGEVKSVLCSTADDIRAADGGGVGFDAHTGYGLVNASKAVAGSKSCYIKGREAMVVGSSIQLSTAQSGSWKWSSGDRNIATVSADGKVTGKIAGEAVISALNTATGTKVSRTIVVYSPSITGKTQVAAGKKATLVLDCNPVAMCTWTSSNTDIATVGSTTGRVTGKKIGVATISARLTGAPHIKISKKVRVVRGPNPMALKAVTKEVAYSGLRGKSKRVSGAITFTKAAKGKVTYKKVSSGSSSKLSINEKTGKITVKKGTPRGTYRIKVTVRAAGNASYKPRMRTITVKIKVV